MSDGVDLCPVSVVMPCREEARFVARALGSILANDYPPHLMEVLVVDGYSRDGTRRIVSEIARREDRVKLLDNPRGIIPAAMNIGIASSSTGVILKADAHSTYAPDYIRKCVTHLLTTGADNVGGVIVTKPARDTLAGRAIAIVLSHSFGSGNSRFRVAAGGSPGWSDSAAFGCYRAEVFDRIGGYDERLVRSSDMELNTRLRDAGGRTLLVPEIVATYYCRSELANFARRNYVDGYWALYPLSFGVRMARLRHVMPAMCLLAALLSSVLVPFTPWPLLGLSCALIVYVALCAFFAVQIGSRVRSLSFTLLLPLVFVLRHAPYAAGSLVGLAKALGSRAFWKRLLGGRTLQTP